MTREERESIYVEKLSEINPNIILVGEYISNKKPVLHKCLKHNVLWDAYPFTLLKGYGCKECGKEKISKRHKMTHEEFVDKFNKLNSDVVIVGKYINNRTKIDVKCKYGHEWLAFPSNILNRQGCKKCFDINRTCTHEEYVKKIQDKNVSVIDMYINSKTKILHKCKDCGYEWNISPSDILSGYGCPECAGTKKKTQEQYIKDVFNVNKNIEVLGEYINSRVKIQHKCKKCNNVWYASPHDILDLHGCPKCNSSSGESKISNLLTSNKILYIGQYKFDDCCDKRSLPFDFYLPDYNICIEYQGIQHYEPLEYFGGESGFELRKIHDRIKRKYCQQHKIDLVEIKYNDDIEESINKFILSKTVETATA